MGGQPHNPCHTAVNPIMSESPRQVSISYEFKINRKNSICAETLHPLYVRPCSLLLLFGTEETPLYSLSFVLCCFRGLGQSLNFKAELQVQNPTLQTLSQVHPTCASPSEEEGDNCSCHHGRGPSEAYRNTAGGRKALIRLPLLSLCV